MAESLRILSLDGGGIRGIIPALVLDALERLSGKPVAELFDLIAGTSTGAILGLGLTLRGADGKPRYSARDMAELYVNSGEEIFSRSVWQRVKSGNGLTDEMYPSSGIERVLRQFFGDARLKDTLVDMLIPAYEIERRQPFLFRSRYARNPPRKEVFDYPIWQVARCTSAAPTYFEPFRLEASDGNYYALVDGGVYANNPAMCALAEAMNLSPGAPIRLVSIGTGELCRPLSYDKAKDWGLIGWARPMLDVVFDGVSDTVDFQARQLLGERFHRFQTQLLEGSDEMDDASPTNVRLLRLHAESLIASYSDQLARLAPLLVR